MTFWSIVRQRCWGLLLVVAGVCIITFIISHLIPGDPARLLSLQVPDRTAQYGWLALYNLVHVLPLMAIVLAFVRTMGARRLGEREGRLLKLLSGLMMFGLGVLLVWAPEKLDQPLFALLVPLAAVALTWLAARFSRN